jgi:hypothetical protein
LNGITSVPNLMKIYQALEKLLVGDTERQTAYFHFLESKLIAE